MLTKISKNDLRAGMEVVCVCGSDVFIGDVCSSFKKKEKTVFIRRCDSQESILCDAGETFFYTCDTPEVANRFKLLNVREMAAAAELKAVPKDADLLQLFNTTQVAARTVYDAIPPGVTDPIRHALVQAGCEYVQAVAKQLFERDRMQQAAEEKLRAVREELARLLAECRRC